MYHRKVLEVRLLREHSNQVKKSRGLDVYFFSEWCLVVITYSDGTRRVFPAVIHQCKKS